MSSEPECAAQYLVQSDEELFGQCEFDRYRAHGPGGQKRNKTDSAVRLRHRPTGVVAIAVESRSQHENRARALQRLRLELALALRRSFDLDSYTPSVTLQDCLIRRADRGTDMAGSEPESFSADGEARQVLKLAKRDVRKPLVYAELLDVILAAQGQVSEAARRLGITTGNLIRLLNDENKVWAEANRIRQRFGLPTLK